MTGVESLEGFIQYREVEDGPILKYEIKEGHNDLPEEMVHILDWGYVNNDKEYSLRCPTTLLSVPNQSPPYVKHLINFFRDCVDFNQDLDGWDLSRIEALRYTFRNAKSFNGDVSTWEVGHITDMEGCFHGAVSFNGDISKWDVSKNTNFFNFLNGGFVFKGDLSNWDVSSAENLNYTFWNCYAFNSDLSNWDVSNVKEMKGTFRSCYGFNQDISSWDVSNVETMYDMFRSALKFNQDISKWDVSNVTNMNNFLRGAKSFNQDLSNWNIINTWEEPTNFDTEAEEWTLPRPIWGTNGGEIVNLEGWIQHLDVDGVLGRTKIIHGLTNIKTDIVEIFKWGYLKEEDLKKNYEYRIWLPETITKVPDKEPPYINSMREMFSGCSDFNDPNISKWDVSKVTRMDYAFSDCLVFDQPLNDWDVSNVTTMRYMFNECRVFDQDLNKWNISNVTDLSYCFRSAKLFNGDISTWDVSNVKNMDFLFGWCESFNCNIIPWKTSNVTGMRETFYFAIKFNWDISTWDVSNVSNMYRCFRGAYSFNQDLSSWCVSKIEKRPTDFDLGTPSWTLPRPIWGTCGGKVESLENFIQCVNTNSELELIPITPGIIELPDEIVRVLDWGFISDDLRKNK